MARLLPGQREVPADVAAAYARDGFWPGRSLAASFETATARTPEKLAVVDDRFGGVTYAKLAEEVARLASALAELGVSPGDAVIVQLPNWRHFTTVHLALTYLCAITVNIPPTYRAHEVRFIATTTRARAIVVADEFRGFNFVGMVDALTSELPGMPLVVVVGDRMRGSMRRYADLLREPTSTRAGGRLDADEVTGISFTSGTTGEPKGVMHTSNTFAAINASVARAHDLGSDDVLFMPAPVGHSIGLMHGVRLAIYLGGTLVLQERWDASRAFELMTREHVTFAAAAPPFLYDVLFHPALDSVGCLGSLRVFMCGGAFVSERLLRAARERLPHTLTTALWGMTEGIGTSCRIGAPLDKLFTTDGVPFPGIEIRIAGTDGRPLPLGEEGELLMRGPQVFVGYYRRTDLNATAFFADGFFRTGDLATMDEDGYVRITGRIKDIIVRGGVNISPAEIERVLSEDPRLERIAVVGLSDERLGERICAFVVPRPGATVKLEDLIALAEQRGLAKEKWPERLVTVLELPMTPSGKILRHVLRERAGGEMR